MPVNRIEFSFIPLKFHQFLIIFTDSGVFHFFPVSFQTKFQVICIVLNVSRLVFAKTNTNKSKLWFIKKSEESLVVCGLFRSHPKMVFINKSLQMFELKYK